ncbi:hypothetical protein BGZ94_002650 [Podila epigama]|nr:hypothetical protein BGZ94_002650 [Podila epigama]
MRCNRFEEARETLEPYATVFPYYDDSKVQGYAGVIEFALWQKYIQMTTETIQDKRKIFQFSDDLDVNMDMVIDTDMDDDDSDLDFNNSGESMTDLAIQGLRTKCRQHKVAAILHLERALSLDRNNDMFLAYLVTLKCGRVDIYGVHGALTASRMQSLKEMRSYLLSLYSGSNATLQSLRLLASIEAVAVEAPFRERVLSQILEIDPTADSERYVKPFIHILENKMSAEQATIVEQIESQEWSTLPAKLKERDRIASFKIRETDPEALIKDYSKGLIGMRHERRLVPWPGGPSSDLHDTNNENTNSPEPTSPTAHLNQHQPNLGYYRPILELLLKRAEYGVMTPWEESQIIRIANLFCFCSLYCRRLTSEKELMSERGIVGTQHRTLPTQSTAATTTTTGILPYFQLLLNELRPHWYDKVAQILAREDDFEVPPTPSED